MVSCLSLGRVKIAKTKWYTLYYYASPTVPSPTVNISQVSNPPLYAGTALTLTCTATLNEAIDTLVDVTAVWKIAGGTVTTDGRRDISDVTQTSNLVYQTTITISPLSDMMDNGQYECEYVVSPNSYSTYVLRGTGSGSITLMIEGRVL